MISQSKALARTTHTAFLVRWLSVWPFRTSYPDVSYAEKRVAGLGGGFLRF